MADSILRLRVSSEEYDNKLKRAAQGLTRYADECRKVGGTLEVVEKETLDYVRALGQMDTTSRTATGKLAEMKKTFTELSVVYKNMTDEEKNSPFGKALSTSLDQLKGRIGESKVQLDDINKSINGGGGLTGALDSLSDKFGMSVQSLAGWGTALAAGKAALDVAKDAFFASEETVDEWGRVMDSSKSLYEGFLTSLNTGDISGYLSRIDSIVKAARAAYDELDRLGTMKTIQAPQMSAQQTENERMRMMIQTGRYIAPVDGRRASMQNGQLLTPDQIKRIEQQLQGGMQKVVTLVGNEVAQTGRAIDAVYNRQAQELGMSLKEFRKGTSSMAEFDKRMEGYAKYQQWEATHTSEVIDTQTGGSNTIRTGGPNPFAEFAKWGTFRVDGDRYNDLVKLIQQRDQQAGSLYGMQSQAYRTMNRAEGITVRQLMGGGSGGSGGGGSRGGFDISSIAFDSNKAMLAAVKGDGEEGPSEVWKAITEGAKEATTEVDNLTAAFEKLNKVQGVTVEGANKESKNMADGWRTASIAIGTVGNAMSELKNPAIDIMTVIGQSIATIALAYAQNLANDKTTSGNIWAFIAAAAASTISMITTIASIHQATGYAQGGIVKGNSYSGDNIYGGPDAMVNAGELVLTKAQQGNLASQLQEGGMRNMNLSGRIRGTDIILSVDRTLSLEGKQLLTWGR